MIFADFALRESFRIATKTHDPAPRQAVPPGVICHENPCLRERDIQRTISEVSSFGERDQLKA